MTQNLDAQDIGLYGSRSAGTEFFLSSVNALFARIQQAHGTLLERYHRLLHSQPPAMQEALEKSRVSWLAARQLLVEASMATHYYNFMLADLERSEKCMDMLLIKVPNHAAHVGSSLCPSEEMRRLADIQRMYHSSESCRSSFETTF